MEITVWISNEESRAIRKSMENTGNSDITIGKYLKKNILCFTGPLNEQRVNNGNDLDIILYFDDDEEECLYDKADYYELSCQSFVEKIVQRVIDRSDIAGHCSVSNVSTDNTNYDMTIKMDRNESSAKKKRKNDDCYLTTVVVDCMGYEDHCVYLDTLREFRDEVMKRDGNYDSLLVEYDSVGPVIAHAINSDTNKYNVAKQLFDEYIKPVCNHLTSREYDKAVYLYKRMVLELKQKYLIQ